ncbi:MAG: hypothetical protein ACYTEQ_30590, partial [Planctomycetota bacterium]
MTRHGQRGPASVNATASGWFRGVQWLEGETGVNIGAKSIADFFEENRRIAAPDRPDFFTDTVSAFGSSLTLVVPQLGVTKAASLAGLSKAWALALEIPAISTNEALVEAGNTYETVLAETGDQER